MTGQILGKIAAIALFPMGLCIGLVVLANLGISFHYHPDQPLLSKVLAITIGLLLCLGPLFIGAIRLRRGPLRSGLRIIALGAGVLLTGAGTYLLINDWGDAILWIWPTLAGLPLLWLGLERSIVGRA